MNRGCWALMLLSGLAAGCSSGLTVFDTAPVTGKVTCNGAPVANVRVYFSPIAATGAGEAGKSGMGTTAADGTYTVSTYGENDGAVIGSHNVIVDAPHPEKFPGFQCDCMTDGRQTLQTVSVAAGSGNTVNIELPPWPKGKRRAASEAEDD